MILQPCSTVNQSRPLVPRGSSAFWNTDTLSLATNLNISRQDPASLNIPESERLISLFGLLYVLLYTLLSQNISWVLVLFRSLALGFFPLYGTQIRIPWFLVKSLRSVWPTWLFSPLSDQRFLGSRFVKIMIDVCAKFRCSALWNF